jgi:hypothetical protein
MSNSQKVGEFVLMTLKQLETQINNINYILYNNNKLLKYYIIKGDQQLVAGMNYKIIIKNYKKYYLLEYFVSLENQVLNIIINRLKTNTCMKEVIYINETFTITKCCNK